MNTRVIDFAETYSKMSDERLSQVLSDEKSLLDAARTALHAEIQRRSLAVPTEEGEVVGEQAETMWENQRRGVAGWLALWCVGAVAIGPLYFFFHLSAQIAQTSLLLGMFGSMSWVGIVAVAAFAVQFVAVIFGIATGVCVFTGKPFALRMVLIYFLLWAAVEALGCALTYSLFQAAGANSASDTAIQEAQGAAVAYLLRDFIVLVAWFAYFKRSRRVRDTFGRNLEGFVSILRKSNPALEYLKSQPQNAAITKLIQVLPSLAAELVSDSKRVSRTMAQGKRRLTQCVFDLELVGGFDRIMEFAGSREIASAFADALVFEAFKENPSAVPTEEDYRFFGTERFRGIAKYALAPRYFPGDAVAYLFGKEYAKVVSGNALDFAYIASSGPMTINIRKWGAWIIDHSLTGRSPSQEEIDALNASVGKANQALNNLVG
jgi:hypothetical protein